MDGAKGNLTQASGNLTLQVADFFSVTGGFGFEQSRGTVTLADGRQLMIYNHLGSGATGWGRRGLLNLAMSEDGITWHKVAVLEQEEKAEFSYPAIIQTEDGLVHMSYTWKRQRIKHVVVDPSKLIIGDVLTKGNWYSE